jgi:hypothetical protein
VRNADGTPNASGMIQEYVEIHVIIGEHKEMLQLAVTELGNDDIFLGFDWLQHHNPTVDWTKSTLSFTRCPNTCQLGAIDDLSYLQNFQSWPTTWTEYITWKEEEIRQIDIQRSSVAMDLAIEQEKKREKKPWYLIVPDEYHEFEAVFTRETFDQLPQHSTWDHPIDLKPDSKPTKGKVYPLAPNEQIELDRFLEENLQTGRIRPSTSPMASPFFFVKKKSGDLRPTQDYRTLNEMTIQNRYPLPLIRELIDRLKKKKFFSKFDVRWGYNNIRIKKGDEWKAAFITN